MKKDKRESTGAQQDSNKEDIKFRLQESTVGIGVSSPIKCANE